MLTIYGSEMCPDCRACKANFDRYGIAYTFEDITQSLPNLKKFLKYRDTDPAFDSIRGSGKIGIPACVREDGTIFTDWEAYLTEQGLEPVKEQQGQACGLDHKGC